MIISLRLFWRCLISVRVVGFGFFFFSSRRRHTRLQGDWSSDVCSSDLSLSVAFLLGTVIGLERQLRQRTAGLRTNTLVAVGAAVFVDLAVRFHDLYGGPRSGEGRGGEKGRSRWAPGHLKKKKEK